MLKVHKLFSTADNFECISKLLPSSVLKIFFNNFFSQTKIGGMISQLFFYSCSITDNDSAL